jgi:PRTRC genetic system protein B
MNDITENFTTLYHPKSALVFYQSEGTNPDMYVEYFDMGPNGSPVNAHPLTVREAGQLAKAMKITEEKETVLTPNGILKDHILYLDAKAGKALWYTKAGERKLYFTERVGIAEGTASVPAMLWKADRNCLQVFALASNRRPTETTTLYHAPFFNVYENGSVCMGNVDIKIKKTASLEEFTSAWEDYFFNSYFSHLMGDHNPIKGNCVSLWENLISTGDTFPKAVLKKSTVPFKTLLK